MGQRHQIYVFVKNDEGKTVGACIHHQWLYGMTAGRKALEVLAYAKKAVKDKYHPFSGGREGRGLENCLLALYQLDMKTGGFNSSASHMNYLPTDTAEAECVLDPRQGDNNDGITVFDFTDKKHLGYCMVNIREKTDDKSDHSVRQLNPWSPCTAEEYVRAYYPQKALDKMGVNDRKEFEKLFQTSERAWLIGTAELARLFPAVFNKQAVA